MGCTSPHCTGLSIEVAITGFRTSTFPLVCTTLATPFVLRSHARKKIVVVDEVIADTTALPCSVPFFFEPNFTAHVAPLAAALRIQAQSRSDDDQGGDGGKVDTSAYPAVVYGEFLKSKVASNFSEDATSGKTGRY